MKKLALTAQIFIALVFIFGILFQNNVVFAERHGVIATGEYTYGDRETREDAKRNALEDAKRNALEKIVVYVKSQSIIQNTRLTEDEIRSHTAGSMQILSKDFRFVCDKLLTCMVIIKAVVDVDMDAIANHPNDNTPPANNNPPSKSNILNGAIELNGHYYKNFELKFNWKGAQKFCESVGGHLVTSETDAEIEILDKLSKKGSNNYWIGGYRDDNGIWRWLNGSVIIGEYWCRGEPSSNSYLNRIMVRADTNGYWQTTHDTETHAFICEWDSAADAHDSTL